MFETHFAQPAQRKRVPVEEITVRFPDLIFDRDEHSDAERVADELRIRLERFVSSVDGAGREPFNWDDGVRERLAAHAVYRGEDYGAAFDDLPTLSRGRLRRVADPFDYEATGVPTLYVDQTSGTSGAPLTVVYSPLQMAVSKYLHVVKAGVRAGVRDLGARRVFTVMITDNPARREGRIAPDPLGLTGLLVIAHADTKDPASLDGLTALLDELEPEAILTKPNLFRILIDHWRASGTVVGRPLFTVSGGAMLSDALRQDMEEFFGCPVVSLYGVSEAGYLGSDCSHGKIHLDESSGNHFEMLPPEGDDGEQPGLGELVLTALGNDCMPLLRYRVGDLVRLSRDTCACGSGGPVLDELRGRSTIVFDLDDGMRLSPTRYMKLFHENPFLAEYQLTQLARRSFHLGIELSRETPVGEREAACLRVRDTIASGMPVAVDIAWEEVAFPEEGAKFARFRSEVTL